MADYIAQDYSRAPGKAPTAGDVSHLILEAMLTQEGARVQFSQDRQQALDCVARDGAAAFDAVLMDVQMPVMDGCVATRELGRLAPGLPVIGLTAHALDDEPAKSLAAPAWSTTSPSRLTSTPWSVRSSDRRAVAGRRARRRPRRAAHVPRSL